MKQKKAPKELNENEKAVCLNCFKEFLDNHFLPSGNSIIFDLLKSANVLKLTNKETLNFYEQARKTLTEEQMSKPEKERKLYLLTGESSLFIVFKAKVLALETFFARLDAEGKNLKDLLIQNQTS